MRHRPQVVSGITRNLNAEAAINGRTCWPTRAPPRAAPTHSRPKGRAAAHLVQAYAQAIGPAQRGNLDHFVTQLAERRELGARGRQAILEVGLVEHDQRRDVLAFGGGDAARHQQVGEAGLGGDDDDDVAEVGGDQLFAEGVGAPQQVAARRQLLDHALAVAAANDLDLVAAGVAALLAARVALQAAGSGIDFVMAAEGGDDDALQARLGGLDGVGAFFHSNL